MYPSSSPIEERKTKKRTDQNIVRGIAKVATVS